MFQGILNGVETVFAGILRVQLIHSLVLVNARKRCLETERLLNINYYVLFSKSLRTAVVSKVH